MNLFKDPNRFAWNGAMSGSQHITLLTCACVPYLRQLAMQWNGIETEIPQQKSSSEEEQREGSRQEYSKGRGYEGPINLTSKKLAVCPIRKVCHK